MNDPRTPAPGPIGQPGISHSPRLPTPAGAPHVQQPGAPHPAHGPSTAFRSNTVAPAVHSHPVHAVIEETIALVEDPQPTSPQPMNPQPTSKIKAFGVDAEKRKEDWKRKSHVHGTGVCRMRSFHGKYSDQGLAHMDDIINEWLDTHPDVEVKFVTSTVGVFEGKIREPALVLNVWY